MADWDAVVEEFDGVTGIWLDTAHQGPLPKRAVHAANRAAARKADPSEMTEEAFSTIPEELRQSLARLIGASPEEIVLGNSTSYGLHLIANGLKWSPGDEVITVRGDYPATVLPWRRLEADGVVHQQVGRTESGLIDLDELASLIGSHTRVVAVTWVDSFTGVADDVALIGRMCRDRGVVTVVNGSQAVGARPVDVRALGIHALVSCGYKWLCGPYGTGFAWLSPELRDDLTPRQAYWLANPAGSDLHHMRDHTIRKDLGVRGFDVFCTANFLNFEPWLAALELVHALDPRDIARHDQSLVDRLLDRLDGDRYAVRGSRTKANSSTLVVFEPRNGDAEMVQRRLAQAGVSTALREGGIRLSPHLFNTASDIDQALTALHT